MPTEYGSLILLNGPSSAGKTTLGRALQAALPLPFLHFSPDLLLFGSVLPRREPDGPFAWQVMRPKVFAGYFRCLAGLLRAGNNVVADFVMEEAAQLSQLVSVLAPYNVFYVGVHLPLDELERRERQRGDRQPGDARRDLETVHGFSAYDFEVDSSGPPQAVAAQVVRAWQVRQTPGLFRTLAGGD